MYIHVYLHKHIMIIPGKFDTSENMFSGGVCFKVSCRAAEVSPSEAAEASGSHDEEASGSVPVPEVS